MNIRFSRLTIALLCSLILLLTSGIVIYAQLTSSAVINASVGISICGNSAKEGGEDCDDPDFGGNDCSTVGYTVGILNCNPDCSYDTSLCVFIPTPTPTPTNTPTPTPTPTPAPSATATPTPTPAPSTQSSSSNSTQTQSPTPTPTPQSILETIQSLPIVEQVLTTVLPPLIQKYDRDEDNTLSFEEVLEGAKEWVSEWRAEREGVADYTRCDLNEDAVCNLQDFSILLYYHT
ncbi:MAG: hypothetical protein IAE95_14530 [Chitinophagaceae bacterium]|nr:hypothetical protein [Chitinophagaceae bacterium]